MNDTGTEQCKECHGWIHWVETQQLWYHDSLTDTLTCPSIDVVPVGV